MSDNYNSLVNEAIQFLESIREILVIGWPGLIKLIKQYIGDKDPFGRYFQVLLYIGNNEGSTMTEFAEYFDLSPATATGLIDRLVHLNLVKRDPSDTDRRKVEISLTKRAMKIYEMAYSFQEKEIKQMVDLLTEEEIEFLIKIAKKLNKK